MSRLIRKIRIKLFSLRLLKQWEIKHKIKADYRYLKKCGIDTQLGFVTLVGKPIIQKYPNSIIRIDSGVTLVSNSEGNVAGVNHPVILATLKEKAIIHLGKNCGLSGTSICDASKVEIREYVGLGANVCIYNTDFHSLNPFDRKYTNEKTLSSPIFIDDILYHTDNWGTKVIEHFQENEKLGIIGVAGGHYFDKVPTGWWGWPMNSINILDNDKIFNNGRHCYSKIDLNNKIDEVVTLDGVWFCIPKVLFVFIKFDEDYFKGFHCYDIDITFQIRNQGYKAAVIFDILIEHFSSGNLNEDWFKNSEKLIQKWENFLPQIVEILKFHLKI